MVSLMLRLYAKVFARERLVSFNKLMYEFSIRGLGIFNHQNMGISGEKNFIGRYVAKYARGKDKFVVFDVGGSKGNYTKTISSFIRNAQIYVFEPHPKTFQHLVENMKTMKNVKCFNIALADKVAKTNLYDYEDGNGSGHASLNFEIFATIHRSKATSYEIDVTTIDTIAETNNLDYIDLLKIDVEGYDLNVLKGAGNLLTGKKISIIQFEFTQLNTVTRVFFKDFFELLSGNYKIFRLLPDGLLEVRSYDPTRHEIFGYQNFVAFLKG